MRSLLHSIPRALRGLRRNWRWALNSVLIVASAISVLGMIVLLYVNVQHAAQFWLSNTSVSVFLEPGVSEGQRNRLLEHATTHPLVRQARLVTPAEGLAALSERLGTAKGLFSRQDADTLPYTIDLEIFVDFRDRIGTVAGQLDGVGDDQAEGGQDQPDEEQADGAGDEKEQIDLVQHPLRIHHILHARQIGKGLG